VHKLHASRQGVAGVDQLKLEELRAQHRAGAGAANRRVGVPVEAARGGGVAARGSARPRLNGHTVAVVQRVVGRADGRRVAAHVERVGVVLAVDVRVLGTRAAAQGVQIPAVFSAPHIVVEHALVRLEALRLACHGCGAERSSRESHAHLWFVGRRRGRGDESCPSCTWREGGAKRDNMDGRAQLTHSRESICAGDASRRRLQRMTTILFSAAAA